MDGREFYDKVLAHPGLEWLGASEAGPAGGEGALSPRDEVVIGQATTGVKHAVPVATVLANPWEELEAVLTGTRDPAILTHLTRIVGYFSRVRNWNRSKLSELADRHAGDYALPERAAGEPRSAPARATPRGGARPARKMAPALV